MKTLNVSVAIVGGGPAGLAAALAANRSGVSPRDILILEREDSLGGILKQCIHNGFGLHTFGEELTGPEYAARYASQVIDSGIGYMLNTTVKEIGKDRTVTAVSPEMGVFTVNAKAVILAMGCRERPRGALNIPGCRPAGIYSAGTAQKFVNIKGYMPGKNVVILGSGDIGLIMARRMTLEGARVEAVCELMPYSGGLARNIRQCLEDFDIPLLLSHTVTEIHGKDRLCGVTISKVDDKRRPIPGSERYIECDTLLLSVGLLPENELTRKAGIEIDPVTGGAVTDMNRETSVKGIFACGNVLHVHDLVDYVSEEAVIAGEAAAKLALFGEDKKDRSIKLKADGRVRYTVPQRIDKALDTVIYFRVSGIYKNVTLFVKDATGATLTSRKKVKVAPGEMETLTLKAGDIERAVGDEFSVGLTFEEA